MGTLKKAFELTLIAVLVIAGTLPALAGQQRTKPVKQEVYPATEPDMPASPKQAAGVARPARVVTGRAAIAKLPDSALAYDPVPSDQVNALSKRLQLVDALIRRHGRAYDYRTHTVHDLELTLAQLDSVSPAQPSAPHAASAPAPTPAAAAALPTPREEDEVDGTIGMPVGD